MTGRRRRGPSPIPVTAKYAYQLYRILKGFGFRPLNIAGLIRQGLKLRFGKENGRVQLRHTPPQQLQ